MQGRSDQPSTAEKPPAEEGWEAGRTSALYDPDTVYRGPEAAERNGLGRGEAPLLTDKDAEPTGPSIYAKGEKKRGAFRMTKGMVSRISDELQQKGRKDQG